MPAFCRHGRLVQNCTICAREQNVESRPLVTPGGRPEPRRLGQILLALDKEVLAMLNELR